MHVVLPEFRRMPSSRDLRAILEKYARPLTEEQVQSIERRLREVLESQKLHVTEADQFYGNSQVWAGRLFLEEAKVPRAPSVSDMACVVAAQIAGSSVLKWYCPEPLVGTWEDAAHPEIRWELGADGAFHTNQSDYAEATSWHVVRYGGIVGDILRLVERWGDPNRLDVRAVSKGELRLATLRHSYVLRRHATALARNVKEMTLAAELEPCPSCGARDASTLALQGGGTRWFLQGPCARCGAARSMSFATAGGYPSNDAAGAFDLGPGASQVIRPAQFLELYDRVELRDPRHVPSREWTDALASLRRALTCIGELAKLLPDGAEAIPDASDPRLTRAWIEATRARLDDLQKAYTAERPRVEREGRENAAPKPVGALTDSARRAHAQWAARGRTGDGRLVLEHHRFVNLRMGWPVFEHARFADCDFTGAAFDGIAIFDGAELERVGLARAQLDAATFVDGAITGGHWTDARLTRTNWTRAKVADADLSGSDLSQSIWHEATVARSNLARAKLANASLDRATFLACDFRDASFAASGPLPASTSYEARFVDCDFRGADWSGRTAARTTFVRCKLAGARGFEGAGALLEDCDVEVAPSTLADELRALLALVRPERSPTFEELREHVERRGVRVTVAGQKLTRPSWAPGVGNAEDVFAELAPIHDVVGIRVSPDRRGIGTSVQLVARRGTLADLAAVTGETRAMPRQSSVVEHAFADPTIAGHRIAIEIEHADGAVKLVTTRFAR